MEFIRHRWQRPPLEARVSRVRAVAPAVRQGIGIVLETVTDPTRLEALGPEWSALFDACGMPQQVFQTFEWLAIWASLYVDARTRLSIVTGRIDGRLVLVWPLVVRHIFGLRVLSCMGEPLSQYGDALVHDDLDAASLDAAFAHVLALPVDVVSLRRVRDDAAIAPLLRRRAGPSTNRQAAPYVDFAGSPSVAAFEKRFPGKLRSGRRRRRRRLEERGAVSFARHGPGAEAAAFVTTAIGFKREWARRTGVRAPALRGARFARFFVAACRAGRAAPALRVSVLGCGEETVGIAISIACKGRLFGHVLAADPDLEAFGVGGILAELTIVDALESGCDAIDLLAPADPYKLEWTTTSVGVGDFVVPRGLLGAAYAALWLRGGREKMRALAKRARPLIAPLSRGLGRRSS